MGIPLNSEQQRIVCLAGDISGVNHGNGPKEDLYWLEDNGYLEPTDRLFDSKLVLTTLGLLAYEALQETPSYNRVRESKVQ